MFELYSDQPKSSGHDVSSRPLVDMSDPQLVRAGFQGAQTAPSEPGRSPEPGFREKLPHLFEQNVIPGSIGGLVIEPAFVPALAATVDTAAYKGIMGNLLGDRMKTALMLNRSHSFEDPLMANAQLKGAVKGALAGVATIGADMAIDHFAFKDSKGGGWTELADEVSPVAFFVPTSWPVRTAIAVGIHVLGRLADKFSHT